MRRVRWADVVLQSQGDVYPGVASDGGFHHMNLPDRCRVAAGYTRLRDILQLHGVVRDNALQRQK